MISLRQSILWRVNIARRYAHRTAHVVLNPVAGLLPPKTVAAVLCGRNDNYTPDFKDRLCTCLDWAFANGLSEAVWVEWNPPTGALLFAEMLTRQFPKLRAYVVPKHLHDAICENPAFGLMEYHAKNVGIRRAKTDWICCTNADIIWGIDVFPWFSLLRQNTVYQTQRVDFRWTGERVTAGLLRDKARCLKFHHDDYVPLDGPGDFTLAERSLWFHIKGYDESLRKHKKHCDDRGVYQFLAHGASVARIGRTFHMDHPNSASYGTFAKDGIEFPRQQGIPYRNPENWGLADASEVEIAERVWKLE